uniref:G protein-coupled receptor n=1 Tax=Panagrellus redivivus TaxID=6233 RepID=A0A7E4UNM2_PANRE
MHFTISYVSVSLFIGLLYRYWALKGNLWFFHSARGIAIIATGNLLYPIPVTIALIISVSSTEQTHYYIKTKYPAYYDMFVNNCCHAISEPLKMIIYASVATLQMIIVAMGSIIVIYKINCLMTEKKANFTKKTYDLHRQLIYSLWVQAFLPTCFLFIPAIIGVLMIINAWGNLRGNY